MSETKLVLTATIGVALLALAPLSAHMIINRQVIPATVQATAPSVSPPWKSLAQYQGNWKPVFAGADAEVMQSYTSGNRQVHLYIAYYANQQQGAEIVNAENILFDRKHWKRIKTGHEEVFINNQLLTVNETTIRSSHNTRLVWSWYWVAGQFTSNRYYSKLLHLKGRLFNGLGEAAVIALTADFDIHRIEAVNAMQDFLQKSSPLQATLNEFSR